MLGFSGTLLIAVLVAGSPVWAEDAPPKVYPVLTEPEHKPIFHNDRIDAYQVRLQPGRGSFFHLHSRDQLGITMSDYTSFNQPLGKAEGPVDGKRGSISYLPHSQLGGTTHRVRAVAGEMWVIGIEFADPAPAGTKPAMAAPGDAALTFPQGSVTRLKLLPGAGQVTVAELIVPTTAGALEDRVARGTWSFEAGKPRWFDKPTRLENRGAEPVELLLIDLN